MCKQFLWLDMLYTVWTGYYTRLRDTSGADDPVETLILLDSDQQIQLLKAYKIGLNVTDLEEYGKTLTHFWNFD